MLASTLAKKLLEQVAKSGDFTVYAGHPTAQYPVNQKISNVDFIHAGDKSISGGMFTSYASWPNCIRLITRPE